MARKSSSHADQQACIATQQISAMLPDPLPANNGFAQNQQRTDASPGATRLQNQDVLNKYFRTPFNQREDFFKNLDAHRRSYVKKELTNIGKSRLRLNSYEDKKGLILALESSYLEWKTHVVNTLHKPLSRIKTSNPNLERYQNISRDPALLQRIKSWDTNQHPARISQHIQTCSKLPPDFGFKAGLMYFKPRDGGPGYVGHDYHHEHLRGKFPHQKIPTHELLKEGTDNPLNKRDDGCIKYFHFPSNNMGWIEEAMARYYGEKCIVPDDDKHVSKMSSAERLLSREFWRGQMHGTGSKAPVHARHMRSRCSVIPRATTSAQTSQNTDGEAGACRRPARNSRNGKNLALFLPYLHWETDNRRANMGRAIRDVVDDAELHAGPGRRQTGKVATTVERKIEKSKSWLKKNGALFQKPKKSPLLKYLVNAAKVAAAMDQEADERLVRANLCSNPPIHVRRTLDQYYFLTSDDTSARDRDQVVYRATGAGRPGAGRATRVVMVDQLWLWILDDSTIITSFPRRWGTNKPDPSGVHKCLRDRLSYEQDIQSVHHLALMIIDECSRVFFDRTKPLDQRPEVIDLFGSAIGKVTERTTEAFDNFWASTAKHPSNALPSGVQDTRSKHLDINPVGVLFKEAQDIVEELNIMQQVFSQQRHVVKAFRRHLGFLNGDVREDRERLQTLVRDFINLMQESRGESTSNLDEAVLDSGSSSHRRPLDDTLQEADILLELIDSRQAELQDLKDSALRTCQQLEQLLSLKQQQASIVEAKAALDRADESVKQGRSIMAFTLVTIFFLPLGFFAAFFGMNNQQSTGNGWMTLVEQIKYMFLFSAIVVSISVSVAFSSWVRVVLTLLFRIPLEIIAEFIGLHRLWKLCRLDYVNLERIKMNHVEKLAQKSREKEAARKKRKEDKESSDHSARDEKHTSRRITLCQFSRGAKKRWDSESV